VKHLSAFALDALALGTETAGARDHLVTCAQCRGDYELAASLREHFIVNVLARTQPRRSRVSWPWLAAPALAVAIGVLVVIARPRPVAQPDLAIKGDATWHVFANRDGQTFAIHDGAQLEPRDRIRFAVTPDGARYLLVASIDGSGAVSIYFPYGGDASARLDPGDHVELPGSIVLDAAPGPERMFAVFSDEPIEAAAVADELRTIAVGGADAIRQAHVLAIAGMRAQASLVFEKAVP